MYDRFCGHRPPSVFFIFVDFQGAQRTCATWVVDPGDSMVHGLFKLFPLGVATRADPLIPILGAWKIKKCSNCQNHNFHITGQDWRKEDFGGNLSKSEHFSLYIQTAVQKLMHENRGRVTRASEKVIWHESKMQHLRAAIAARAPILGLRGPDYVNSVL